MSKQRTSARAELAAVLDRIAECNRALVENDAKIETVNETIYAIHAEETADKEFHPITPEEIAAKRASARDREERLGIARASRDAVQRERTAIESNLSVATARIKDAAKAVVAAESPIAQLIKEYRALGQQWAARSAEISALLSLAGLENHRMPQEFIGWNNQFNFQDLFRATPWRAWAVALETDPDATPPAAA